MYSAVHSISAPVISYVHIFIMVLTFFPLSAKNIIYSAEEAEPFRQERNQKRRETVLIQLPETAYMRPIFHVVTFSA